MSPMEETRHALLKYAVAYPKMQPRDLMKYLFHSSFGCDHMVTPDAPVAARIQAEWTQVGGRALTELLPGGKYARVHLGWLGEGLSADTLARIFRLSAKPEENGAADLAEKLAVAVDLVREGTFAFDQAAYLAELEFWRDNNYPAIHHSEAFRQAYCPAYRVVDARFVPYLPVFARIDTGLSQGRLRLAIEGGSASGKTTFAAMLEEIYGCAVIHTDDFFLQSHQRTTQRLAEAGGNLDRERLLQEVLVPLTEGERVRYRRFNCGTMALGDWESLPNTPLTVVEGAYSMHPELAKYYDLAVFLKVSGDEQARRVLHRNSPAFSQRYLNEWIPMENRYFDAFEIQKQCDIVL